MSGRVSRSRVSRSRISRRRVSPGRRQESYRRKPRRVSLLHRSTRNCKARGARQTRKSRKPRPRGPRNSRSTRNSRNARRHLDGLYVVKLKSQQRGSRHRLQRVNNALERVPQNRIWRHLERLRNSRHGRRKIIKFRFLESMKPSRIDEREFDRLRHRISRFAGRQLLRRVDRQSRRHRQRRHFRAHVHRRQHREQERCKPQHKTNVGSTLYLMGRILLVLGHVIVLRHNGDRRGRRRVQGIRKHSRGIRGPVLSNVHIEIIAVLFQQRVLQINDVRFLINDKLGQGRKVLNHELLLVFQRKSTHVRPPLFAHAGHESYVGPLQGARRRSTRAHRRRSRPHSYLRAPIFRVP